MKSVFSLGLLGLFVIASLAGPAVANPTLGEPGSILIFPLFDSTTGGNTLITVTNTNQDHTICFPPGVFRHGDIKLQYFYIDGVTWECTDVCEELTPADTITVMTRSHNPNMEVGFLVVQALDPHTGSPVKFNHLIGSAIVVDTEFDFQWSYLPYSFRGLARDSSWQRDPCGRPMIPYDGDGCILFDGLRYETFPDILYLDNFFGEGSPDGFPTIDFSNQLYLMSTLPGEDDTAVSLIGYNNNERRFSRTFRFPCWLSTSLGEITGSVTQANLARSGDPDELQGVATGWLQLEAQNLPDQNVGILGVFMHQVRVNGGDFTAGRSLQFESILYGRGRSVRICCGGVF